MRRYNANFTGLEPLGELFVFRVDEHFARLRQGMKMMRYERIREVDDPRTQVLDVIRGTDPSHAGWRTPAYGRQSLSLGPRPE